MKKISLLLIMLFVVSNIMVGCGKKEEVKQTSQPKQEQKLDSKPEGKAEKITFSNVTVKGHDGVTEVLGEVKNNDDKKHTFTIIVTFYDTNKKILGTAIGTVNDLESGKTKTFEAAAAEDFSKASSNKIEVDTIVE